MSLTHKAALVVALALARDAYRAQIETPTGRNPDWFAIARLSGELLHELPATVPPIVKAYLTDCDIRRASPKFAIGQMLQLIHYLRSNSLEQ